MCLRAPVRIRQNSKVYVITLVALESSATCATIGGDASVSFAGKGQRKLTEPLLLLQ